MSVYQHIQLALCIRRSCIFRFNQPRMKKKFRKFQKAKLEFAMRWQLFTNHLHCMRYYK